MKPLATLLFALLFSVDLSACTIVSAVGGDGTVWNMNNEDGPATVGTFISVFPRTEGNRYGYYTLSYLWPRAGEGGNAQGGMNEAGLTFDFNAIRYIDDFDPASRKNFPEGNDAIFAHILGNMGTVDEVIAFFETYWFEDGFRSAQMHVADRDGKFALISASGVYVAEAGEPLVSTNFDICGKEDGSSCWRYPLAREKLAEREVNLATMLSIALDTRQKQYTTLYSNVQNLTTGDIWFLSYHDPNELVQVNLAELLRAGRRSYSFLDLRTLKTTREPMRQLDSVRVDPVDPVALVGTYQNAFIGDMDVVAHESGLAVDFGNGTADVFLPVANGIYAKEDEDMAVAFRPDPASGKLTMELYLDGWWSATGWRNGR